MRIDHLEPEKKECSVWAVLGSIVIGVTLPTLLVCWNSGWDGPEFYLVHKKKLVWQAEMAKAGRPVPQREFSVSKLIGRWIWLQTVATIGCGPGAAILTIILFERSRRRSLSCSLRATTIYGIALGCIMAFLNFPGYLAPLVMPDNSNGLAKMIFLFIVAGASCGAWVAWQAWRATHPEEKFWPRFSLGTLMIAVIAWGALLAVFAPK